MLVCDTERLLIRRLSLADLPDLMAILSDPEVMKHSIGGVCDEVATRKFLDWCLACYSSYAVGPWALVDRDSSELIGYCGVGPEQVAGQEETNLGYRLARHHWGKGLATEAARAVVDYGFCTQRLDSIVVIIEPDHGASLRVAEKTGFTSFTTMPFLGRDVRLYRMNRTQWRQQTQQ